MSDEPGTLAATEVGYVENVDEGIFLNVLPVIEVSQLYYFVYDF